VGARDGFIVGLALGLITLATDPYFVHPIQILLDYPLPGLALGLAGLPMFRTDRNWWKGVLAGGFVRYVFHVISGLVFFATAAPSWHMSPLLYSLAYNAAYVAPSMAIAILALTPCAASGPCGTLEASESTPHLNSRHAGTLVKRDRFDNQSLSGIIYKMLCCGGRRL